MAGQEFPDKYLTGGAGLRNTHIKTAPPETFKEIPPRTKFLHDRIVTLRNAGMILLVVCFDRRLIIKHFLSVAFNHSLGIPELAFYRL